MKKRMLQLVCSEPYYTFLSHHLGDRDGFYVNGTHVRPLRISKGHILVTVSAGLFYLSPSEVTLVLAANPLPDTLRVYMHRHPVLRHVIETAYYNAILRHVETCMSQGDSQISAVRSWVERYHLSPSRVESLLRFVTRYNKKIKI